MKIELTSDQIVLQDKLASHCITADTQWIVGNAKLDDSQEGLVLLLEDRMSFQIVKHL